jgi:oxalate decarboxylase/phosphoglucose isomerase-like protein (cupin superfamily)
MAPYWNEPFDLKSLSLKSDPRGDLFEVIRFVDHEVPGQGQSYVFTINPGFRRGDHYHKIKREWFCCVFGEVKVLLTLPDGSYRALQMSAKAPQIFYAGPGTTHALINETGSTAVVLSYSSTQHSDEAPDTYPNRAYPEYQA